MTTNGSYVTRAELAAHLEPMRDDIKEIGTDVKVLLNAYAAQQAVADNYTKKWSLASTKAAVALVLMSALSLALSLAATTQRVWF